jgi:hypothetical protein
LTFDSDKKRLFLAAIRRGMNVAKAAKFAGATRSLHYYCLKAQPEYAAAFEDAKREGYEYRVELLEDLAFQHALKGVAKPVVYQGQVSRVWNQEKQQFENEPLTITEFDHTLLMNLLRAGKPARYRERHEVEHTGDVNLRFKGTFADLLATYRELTRESSTNI